MALPVVLTLGGAAPDLRVKCSCGWEPSGGGEPTLLLTYIRHEIKRHRGLGHEVNVRDPESWLERVPEAPMSA
jgi:hypothetical protein